jgi:DNA mismatch repair protein MutS2
VSDTNRNEPLKPGQCVLAPGFRQPFEVIEGPDRSGRYVVGRGSVTLRLARSQLQPVDVKKRCSKHAATPPLSVGKRCSERVSVDLHGLRVDEALLRLTSIIDRAILDGTREVEVIHGLGTGKVKKAVLDYLKSAQFVQSFAINPTNPGSTTVVLG